MTDEKNCRYRFYGRSSGAVEREGKREREKGERETGGCAMDKIGRE